MLLEIYVVGLNDVWWVEKGFGYSTREDLVCLRRRRDSTAAWSGHSKAAFCGKNMIPCYNHSDPKHHPSSPQPTLTTPLLPHLFPNSKKNPPNPSSTYACVVSPSPLFSTLTTLSQFNRHNGSNASFNLRIASTASTPSSSGR